MLSLTIDSRYSRARRYRVITMGYAGNRSRLVAIGRFLPPTEAQIAKGMLEAAGIQCHLQSEKANNMLALASRARLKVRLEDAEAACELLHITEPSQDVQQTAMRFDA